jgi:hypothetical protein
MSMNHTNANAASGMEMAPAKCSNVETEPRSEAGSEGRSQASGLLGGRRLGYYNESSWNDQVEAMELKNATSSGKETRRVHFDDECIVYEVTPYAEIYGLHPREFVFNRDYSLSPVTRNTGIQVDAFNEDDWESDQEGFDCNEWDLEYCI